MILMGSFSTFKLLSAISALGVILAAIYMLWAYQRMFTGEIQNEENRNLSDLNTRELASVVPLLVLMLIIGIYPAFIESYVLNDAQKISDLVQLFSGGLN